MKINCTFNLMALSKVSTQSKDGQSTYYKLNCEVAGGDAGSLNCTKEVYEKAERFKNYVATATYDDKYNFFRLVDVVPAPERK